MNLTLDEQGQATCGRGAGSGDSMKIRSVISFDNYNEYRIDYRIDIEDVPPVFYYEGVEVDIENLPSDEIDGSIFERMLASPDDFQDVFRESK
jgi:hypothetical protein